MNVQQLIEELQKHPPKTRVIVEGYEGGYSDLMSLQAIQIRLNVHEEDEWFYGRHDDADYPFSDKESAIESALLLPR